MATPRPCLEHTSARANSALRPCRSWRSTCAPTQHLVAELPPGLWAECSYYSCAAKHDTDLLICFGNTGIKFVVLADPKQTGIDSLLRKIYEIYSDFALKNPFYSLEMPIRCELFDQNLKLALEVAEKAGSFGPGS
uniref:Trafficking protein particle complex subunit n=1 Tax=Nothoprocta perdicaria TaxID=30464 RepID=A0A8C7E9V8_NOTPE